MRMYKELLKGRMQTASAFGILSCVLTSLGTAASWEASTSSWSPTNTGACCLPSGCKWALPGTFQMAL